LICAFFVYILTTILVLILPREIQGFILIAGFPGAVAVAFLLIISQGYARGARYLQDSVRNSKEPNQSQPSVGRRVSLAVAAILVYIVFAAWSLFAFENPESRLIIGHFTAIVALPMAAALAFILVTLMPVNYGRVELQALGITLKGASAPIVLWVICFVVIVVAVKILW
jgi:hypothetical protein